MLPLNMLRHHATPKQGTTPRPTRTSVKFYARVDKKTKWCCPPHDLLLPNTALQLQDEHVHYPTQSGLPT